MLSGSIVALVTPMAPDGAVHWQELDALIDWHIASGTSGIVPMGTTGESATLGVDEHLQVIDATVKRVAGRIPVIAGTGANSTAEAIHQTQEAERLGADACLLVTPYYNRPTQQGLVAHYEAIAAATSVPLVLYNVPPRTACDMLAATVAEVANIDSVIGIKEACGDPERAGEIRALCDDSFIVLSGEDAQTLRMAQLGAVGTISVSANVVPVQMAEFCGAFLAGDMERAATLDTSLQPVHDAMFIESSPQPVKWALTEMGKISAGIRPAVIATVGVEARAGAGGTAKLRCTMSQSSFVTVRHLLGFIAVVMLLAGCGRWMNDDKGLIVKRSDDYLDVPVREKLQVPGDLSDGRVQEPFSIPPIQNSSGTTYPDKAPRPTPILAGTETEGVKIQKLGDRRWLVLGETPSVVWPKLKRFLAENGVETVFEAALSGRITTGWFDVENADNRDVVRLAVSQGKTDAAASGGRDRVNFSVEQGMRENTTEVHVRHQNDVLGSAEDLPDEQLLSTESAVAEVEEGLLRELGGYLASDVSSQSVSRAGQDLVGATKAELGTASDGQPVLRLNLDFDRAWATVNQSLNNAQVAVTDLDRSDGVFYIELPEGLLSGEPTRRGLFGRKREGDLLAMQILVAPADSGGYQVRAVDNEAAAIEPDRAREVLNMIREFAI